MKVYISGKISGLPEAEYRSRFEAAEQQLRELGYEPVSPLNNGLHYKPDVEWKFQMLACIKQLVECEAIYMLTNWADSQGAGIEHDLAKGAGMEIMYQ